MRRASIVSRATGRVDGGAGYQARAAAFYNDRGGDAGGHGRVQRGVRTRWLVTASLIAMASFQPVACNIGHRMGSRRLVWVRRIALRVTRVARGQRCTARLTGTRQLNTEELMTKQGAQYDHIGSKYDEYARTATLKRAESYTFFRMVGALDGQRVLDLACGLGFYTRLLKQRGAAQVIGVDISPEMIRLAHQQEQAEPLGIAYQVRDAVTLPPLGPFDLVTAVYLLNYATSKDQMLGMFRSAYDNLWRAGASSPTL
jgi:2-polyprenyl-3-methyl-5-hydroxy-6-metoxy-1,4-benzoquinol methylase